MIRQALGASILSLVMGNAVLALPGETITGPVTSPDHPKCKIFMVNKGDGSQGVFWARGRKIVKAGGTCPEDYIPGRRINSTLVDVTNPGGTVYRCDISANSCTAR